MKLVIQRTRGPVRIVCSRDSQVISQSSFEGVGLMVLMGWLEGDTSMKDEEWLVSRTEGLRIFPDGQGKLNLNLADYLQSTSSTGGILWVSQFTLGARLESGFRPSFSSALAPDVAKERFNNFKARQLSVARPYSQIFGEFGADMDITFTNWGPVTIPLQT